MKNIINDFLNRFKSFFKDNFKYLIGFFISTNTIVFGSYLASLPFDNQVKNEATSYITSNASLSDFNLSVNSIQISPRGNSDYWIMTSNKLQDFQMRNQHNTDERSYVFATYESNNSSIPFKYNEFNCTIILFESKFQQNNFYFDMPLLAGSLPRTTSKNNIYITDTFANKIKNDSDTYDTLIGKQLDGQSMSSTLSSNVNFQICGIFDTNNDIGKLFNCYFGSNVIFAPEYNIFQMNSSLYFFGSRNSDENKAIVDYVFDNYKSSYDASGGLETGYNIKYNFYDFDNQTHQFKLDKTNENLNKIIETYKNQSAIFSIIGIVLIVSASILLIVTTWFDKTMLNNGKFMPIIFFWLISSVSLFVISLIYKFAPFLSIVSKIKFITRSKITSTYIFISWIAISLITSFIPLLKKSIAGKKNHN